MTVDELTSGERAHPRRYEFERRDLCPACGSGEHRTLYSSPFEGAPIAEFVESYYKINAALLAEAPYELQRCGACGLVFQHFVGGPELLSDLYTHWVDEPADPERDIPAYRSEMEAVRLSGNAHEIMAAASYLRLPLNELRTLDYGMGWALWARIAAELGCRSYGSDLAEPRMEFARRRGVETVTDDQLADHRFDFINTEQVFEHVPQPLELLKRLADALAPGAIVKLSVPSGERMDRVLAALASGSYRDDPQAINPVHPLEHVNCFTRSSIDVMAAKARMEVVRPGLYHRYAFLRHSGTVSLRRPKKMAKELIRPVYQYRNPSNLYVWLQKPR